MNWYGIRAIIAGAVYGARARLHNRSSPSCCLSQGLCPMGEKYIFTIQNLTKLHGKKEALKDIWLAFYPGAKIGVIGPNGAGKSTLLRIMALADKDFLGSADPAPGTRI